MSIPTAEQVADWADLEADAGTLETIQTCVDAVEASLLTTYDFDPDDCPADVFQAVLMQSARLYRRRTTPDGIATFGQDFAVRVNRFDPDIDALLEPYKKWVCA